MNPPKVFISYSHDSQEHKAQVLEFSNRLRSDGIDCNIDQYQISPPEGWPRWMNNQIEEADFVLVICTETYGRRFKGKEGTENGLGVKWEGAIISQEIYEAESKNTSFIPVIFSSEHSVHIPIILRSATHYNLKIEEYYEELYRHLTNQPNVIKPELGKLQPMPPRERKQDFLDSKWNVPYIRNPFFTGRENVLEQLHEALISNKSVALAQPLAISGLGGIGKTQTAVEYAYRYCKEYKAILWAKADSYEALVSEYVAIADVLNLPEKDEPEQNIAVNAVKRWLKRNSGWLLILDNADDTKLVEDFLPFDTRGHILLTSRAQVFDNLGIANPIELERMSPEEAKQFFLLRTGRTDLDTVEIDAIEQLISELDYLPLALEQAGAYISKLKSSFQDYLSSYRKRGLELLEKSQAMSGKYPKSVATTWLLNFEQVEQTSKAAADLLFASTFLNHDKIPFEIIIQGADELGPMISSALTNVETDPIIFDEILEPLTQYSLIHRDSVSSTYNVHRLVQAVLKDRMDEPTQCLWSERTVLALNCAFPKVEFSNWHLCERLLPHAQTCLLLIKKCRLEIREAAILLTATGNYLYERARFEEAESLFTRSIAIWEKFIDTNYPDLADSLNNLGLLYFEQGKYVEAEQFYQRALDIREKVFEPNHPSIANSLNNFAVLYSGQGKYAQAEEFFKKALVINEKALGSEHLEVASNVNNLASLYFDQGKYTEAEPLYQRALNIRENVLNPDHPHVANSLHNLGNLYQQQGKYSEAEPLFMRALKITEKSVGPDHPHVASSLNGLATLLNNQRKYTEAEPLYKRALDIREKTFGYEHSSVANSLNGLATLYNNQFEYDKAEPLYKRALDINEKMLGHYHLDVANTHYNLGTLYYDQRKYVKAIPFYKKAIEIYKKNPENDHPTFIYILENYAELLRTINRRHEAARIVAQVKAIRGKPTVKDSKTKRKLKK